MDSYVVPGHHHVFEQQAHDLPPRVEVGVGRGEPSGDLEPKGLDGLEHRRQLRARVPFLLELSQLGLDLGVLARQLLAPGGQFVQGDHALLLGIQ